MSDTKKEVEKPQLLIDITNLIKEHNLNFTDGKDSIFVFGNIDKAGICYSKGKAGKQLSVLVEIMKTNNNAFQLFANAFMKFLEDKDMQYLCTIFTNMVKLTMKDDMATTLFACAMEAFIDTYKEQSQKRQKIN